MQDITESDCFVMIQFFGTSNSNFLLFADFLQILMPCDAPDLRAEISQRVCVDERGYLDPVVERELALLLEKEIHFNRLLEYQKQKLTSDKQFDYQQAFLEIDDWGYGYIDVKNLKNFLGLSLAKTLS